MSSVRQQKPNLIGVIIVIIFVAVFVIAIASKVTKKESGKMIVTTSFYPMYEFSKNVADENAQIINITPAGSEPHDFEPSPQDIANIYKSKIFIYNGLVEPWVPKIVNDLSNKGVSIVKSGENLIQNNDPHIWLDPILAKEMVIKIKDAFIQSDPLNTPKYQMRASLYLNQLDDLDRQFKTGLSDCKQSSFLTSHAAFSYLAKRYGLKMIAIAGLSPDEEPTPQKLSGLVDQMRNLKIKYVFFETLVSPKLSDTIANEVGAQVLVLNPLEGLTSEELQEGKNYISIQKENLLNLQMALECK